jgi:hypothetical protein
VRQREPGGDWTESFKVDLPCQRRVDSTVVNRTGGLGAVVLDHPSEAQIQEAIEKARAWLQAQALS